MKFIKKLLSLFSFADFTHFHRLQSPGKVSPHPQSGWPQDAHPGSVEPIPDKIGILREDRPEELLTEPSAKVRLWFFLTQEPVLLIFK